MQVISDHGWAIILDMGDKEGLYTLSKDGPNPSNSFVMKVHADLLCCPGEHLALNNISSRVIGQDSVIGIHAKSELGEDEKRLSGPVWESNVVSLHIPHIEVTRLKSLEISLGLQLLHLV